MTKTYKWKCGFCKHASDVPHSSIEEAARESVIEHSEHSKDVFVVTDTNQYIGLSYGLLFNSNKIVGSPTETVR